MLQNVAVLSLKQYQRVELIYLRGKFLDCRSCADCYFTLISLIEKHKELNRETPTTFIGYLKKLFNLTEENFSKFSRIINPETK